MFTITLPDGSTLDLDLPAAGPVDYIALFKLALPILVQVLTVLAQSQTATPPTT